jgi:hypothetical protein
LLTAGVWLDPPQVRPGDTAVLGVKIRLAPMACIGPLDIAGTNDASTRIEVDLPAGLERAGPWQSPEPGEQPDGSRVYYSEALFRLPLKVTANAAGGPVKIRCGISYRVSNILLSWPRGTTTVEAAGEVLTAR